MKKKSIKKLLNTTAKFAKRNSSTVMIVLSAGGMIAGGFLLGKGAAKAHNDIEEKKEELGVDKLTPKETVKTTWKSFAPGTVVTGVSLTAFALGHKVKAEKFASLLAAYKIVKDDLSDHKEIASDILEPEQIEKIEDAVAQKKVDKNPPTDNNVVILGEDADTLFYDELSGRYFKSTLNRVKDAQNRFNEKLQFSMGSYASLNDLYDELDLERTKLGDDLGWDVMHGLVYLKLDRATVAPNGKPAILIEFNYEPRYGYDRTCL